MRFISLALACLLSACATVQTTAPQVASSSEERIVDRSYERGKERTTFVGDTMARVKDYRVRKSSTAGVMQSSSDFSMSYPPFGYTVRVRAVDPIPVVGKTQRDGVDYTLIRLPNGPPVSLLISSDGHFEGSGLGIGNARMGYTYTPEPASVTLRPGEAESTAVEAGYLNFEIVYSGATKDSIRLLYREYTPKDLVRPAFSQELVYERDATTIRFRSMVMRVIQASSEQIRFVVLEDGYQ